MVNDNGTYVDISDDEILRGYRVMLIPEGGSMLQTASIPLSRLKRILDKKD